MEQVEVWKNTEDVLVLYFQPGDGSAYQIHMQRDRYGGVLVASTFASPGLFRWFPGDGKIKIIHADCAEHFAEHFDGWMSKITIEGEYVPMLCDYRWC